MYCTSRCFTLTELTFLIPLPLWTKLEDGGRCALNRVFVTVIYNINSSLSLRFSGYEKDVLMLSKKSPNSPFNCFIGKGIIDLPPQFVYDSIRNPQLRFTYDNMLKVRVHV